MKKGCAVLLLVWTLSAVGYWWLLAGTATDWPMLWAMMLGLALMALLGCVFGLLLSLGRARALKNKPNAWKDGEFVAAAGWLSACREALTTPLTGQPALLFQVEVKRTAQRRVNQAGGGRSAQTSTQNVVLVMGMAPCEVRGAWSSTRLVGYPLLAEHKPEAAVDTSSRQRLADWLLRHPPQQIDGGLAERWKRLQAVYADADGELLEVFAQDDAEFDRAFATAQQMAAAHSHTVGVAHLAQWFEQQQCQLLEKRIAPNAEVCAFGQWDAAARRLDVGSAMQHLGRDVLPGSAQAVGARVVRRSVVALLVMLTLSAILHWLVWEWAGRPIWWDRPIDSRAPVEAEAAETPRVH